MAAEAEGRVLRQREDYGRRNMLAVCKRLSVNQFVN